MHPSALVTLFIAPLTDLGIPYMVTGAMAPLHPHLDVVMPLGAADANRIAPVFPATDFYVPTA